MSPGIVSYCVPYMLNVVHAAETYMLSTVSDNTQSHLEGLPAAGDRCLMY